MDLLCTDTWQIGHQTVKSLSTTNQQRLIGLSVNFSLLLQNLRLIFHSTSERKSHTDSAYPLPNYHCLIRLFVSLDVGYIVGDNRTFYQQGQYVEKFIVFTCLINIPLTNMVFPRPLINLGWYSSNTTS